MRAALLLAAALPLIGCIAPITPMERLQQSANDVAAALRFGRTDLAAEFCSKNGQGAFLERHAYWAGKTRVVDLELSGIFLRSSDEAEAIIQLAWLDEGGADLHTTEISQRWKHEGGSFRLSDEVYRGGDKALFDMLPKKEDAKKTAASPPGSDAKPSAAPAGRPQARVEAKTIHAE